MDLLNNETDLEMRSRVVAFYSIALEEALYPNDHFKMLNNKIRRLLNTYPLPDDAEAQLDRLIEQADNKQGKFLLSQSHEALFVLRHE
ncbi:hypothetical protein A9G47_09550 [Gilliamella sp. WF3-4]|jgi:hypothetical protein|nr:hypothetical protein A9G47_09550 [Gilliamella apicola]